jgi:hypothetical protein
MLRQLRQRVRQIQAYPDLIQELDSPQLDEI